MRLRISRISGASAGEAAPDAASLRSFTHLLRVFGLMSSSRAISATGLPVEIT